MPIRSSRLIAALAGGLLAAALPGAIAASPLDDPYVGGIGLSGPATGDLAALYWNPAALGLITDKQAMVAGSGRFTRLTARRHSIDPATGAPGDGRSFATDRGTSYAHPFTWPPGGGGFLAVGAALGARVSLGLGTFAPYGQQLRWRAGGDDRDAAPSTRFHALEVDLRNVALVSGIAIGLGRGVRLGMAPGLLFSVGRLVFDEDTALASGAGASAPCGGAPCGAENPAAAARYDVASSLDVLDSAFAFTLSGGLHVQLAEWAFGLSYTSRPLGTTGGGVDIAAPGARIDRPARASGAGTFCPSPDETTCFFGHIQYNLPDMVAAGANYHVSPRLQAGLVLRWLNLSVHDAVRVRLGGPANGSLEANDIPERVVLYRGFKDVLDTRLRAALRVGERALLVGLLRFETSAVDAEAVSPAAIDGFKVEPALAARINLGSWLVLGAGYAFTWMPAVDTGGTSVFDPGAARACQDVGGHLGDPACDKQQRGLGRPTAAGRYTQIGHTVSLTLSARL